MIHSLQFMKTKLEIILYGQLKYGGMFYRANIQLRHFNFYANGPRVLFVSTRNVKNLKTNDSPHSC